MNERVNLTIVIPTTGNKDILLPTLDALFQSLENENVEVTIVNDSDKELNVIDYITQVNIIKSGGKGAANARNIGWRSSTSEYVLFMDDDIIVTKSAMDKVFELMNFTTNIAYNFSWRYPRDILQELERTAFGAYIIKSGRHTNMTRLGKDDRSISQDVVLTKGLSSAFFLIRRSQLEVTGGYDNRIPMAGVEDTIFYQSLERSGIDVNLLTNEIVYHNEWNKLNPRSFISRNRTGAWTRKIATFLGYKGVGLGLNRRQKYMARLILPFTKFLLFVLDKIDYSFLYHKIMNGLLLSTSYQGFYQDPLPGELSEETDKGR